MSVINKELNLMKGCRRDVYSIGGTTGVLPMAAIFVHCNVAGTYRLYSDNDNYTDDSLLKGYSYPGPFTKITTTADGRVDAEALTVRF